MIKIHIIFTYMSLLIVIHYVVFYFSGTRTFGYIRISCVPFVIMFLCPILCVVYYSLCLINKKKYRYGNFRSLGGNFLSFQSMGLNDNPNPQNSAYL